MGQSYWNWKEKNNRIDMLEISSTTRIGGGVRWIRYKKIVYQLVWHRKGEELEMSSQTRWKVRTNT